MNRSRRILESMIPRIYEVSDAIAELTEKPTQDQVAAAWIDGVVYKGEKVFDTVFSSDNLKELESAVSIGEYVSDPDDDTGFGKIVKEGSDVYLGYNPRLDQFLIGFNTDFGSEVVLFKIVSDGKLVIQDKDSDAASFYDKLHRKLKVKYPDLIDIRIV